MHRRTPKPPREVLPLATMQTPTLHDAVAMMRAARGMLTEHRHADALELYDRALRLLCSTRGADGELLRSVAAAAAWLRAAACDTCREGARALLLCTAPARRVMLDRNQAVSVACHGQQDRAAAAVDREQLRVEGEGSAQASG